MSKANAAERRRDFAEAYAGDPSSPTFRNAEASVRHVFLKWGTELKDSSLHKMAERYLHHPEMAGLIDAVMQRARVGTGVSGPDYVQRCLENEQMLLTRGGRGDSQAAVAYAKLAGTALGYLIVKHEDVTPIERKPLTVEALLAVAERLKRLSEPNPLPVLQAPVDAEFEVIEEGKVTLDIEPGDPAPG